MKYKEFKRWSLISLSVDLIFSAVTANRNSLQIFRHWTKDNMADFCEPFLLSSVQERTSSSIFYCSVSFSIVTTVHTLLASSLKFVKLDGHTAATVGREPRCQFLCWRKINKQLALQFAQASQNTASCLSTLPSTPAWCRTTLHSSEHHKEKTDPTWPSPKTILALQRLLWSTKSF